MGSALYRKIYAIVKQIPAGQVATYGQIATLAAIPGQARQVGYALHALPDNSDVPWHRVINARGEISIRSNLMAAEIQRKLLETENITFSENSRIPLETFRWVPEY